MDIEILRSELKKVSDIAPKGSHVEVASIVGISVTHLFKIRVGDNLKIDSKENRDCIQSAIDAYRSIIRRELNKYESI